MTTAQFFFGASLFVLLIVDICCFPSKKASNPSTSYGSSDNVGSNQGAPPSQNSPVVMTNVASSGVYAPSYPPVPQPEPIFYQPAVQRGPAAPGSSSATGPVESGYMSSAATGYPAYQPSPPQDVNWVVPLPIFGAEVMPAVGPSGAGFVSPPLPPPRPEYQAGELSHYENSNENGEYQMETEDQGFPPPPPFMSMPAGPSFTSQPQPYFGRSWIVYPYPYYDYMFMTGQYPPGTVSHSSSSFEQGTDHWQDAHYVRDYPPYNPGSSQQAPPEVPQSFKDPQPPIKGGYGHGDAAVNQPSSPGNVMQPTRRLAGGHKGYNSAKVGQ